MVSLFPHPASFRFRLTTDPLAFGYLLPATGRIRVFHPLESCAAGRTQTGVVSLKRGNSFLVQKSIRTMKIRMLAVECNYHETNLPQTDYTAMTNGFQLIMPLDCEVNIEKDAPVRLLNPVMERMD